MSLIALPEFTGAASVEWGLIDFGTTQSSPLGGSDQRVNRLGNRWRMVVTLPAMDPISADEWAAALAEGLGNGVSWKVPEPGWPKGAPGSLLVKGAGQTGGSLEVDGGTVGRVIRRGKWFSILTGSRPYLHKATATVRIDADGEAILSFTPLLRVSPADNAPIELAAPRIEGLLEQAPGWSIDRRRIAEGVSFAIREVK
jgi:hypothetical protein